MTEENKLIRQSKPDVTITPESALLPSDLDFDKIHTIVQNTDLPWLEKRRLVKVELRAQLQKRKEQIDAALTQERMKLQAGINVADKAVKLYETGLIWHIRRQFVEMASKMGRQLENKQLEFLTEFAEDLTKFERELKKTNISSRFKQDIQQRIDKAWNRVLGKLDQLTEDVIKSAKEEAEKS